MLRGGMGYYGSPYQDASKKAERLLVSGGIGYRFGPTSLDLAVVNTSFKSAEVPYTLNQDVYGNIPVNLANLKNSNTRVALTFGVKF